MPTTEIEHVWWDWNEDPVDDIKTALRRMGLYAYSDPIMAQDGTTCNGIIISKERLTRSELRKIGKSPNDNLSCVIST
jgi:hypothetical protein